MPTRSPPRSTPEVTYFDRLRSRDEPEKSMWG